MSPRAPVFKLARLTNWRRQLMDRIGPGRAEAWTIIAFVVVAALLRTWHLDHLSIWQDEGLSLYRATQDLAGILSGVIHLGSVPTHDVQPPLYFLVLAGWFKLAGSGTWTAKWFSMSASLPAVPLVWALGRR